MKKICLFALAFLCLHAHSQKPDTVKLITPFGKPDGKEASEKIGKEGGKLLSNDARVELIIPPGALSKKTTISIQPVKNTLSPTGRKSYHMQPSGVNFKEPVQIIFYYSGEDNSDVLARGIAMQDEKGRWHDLADVTVDSVKKTISGKISHFSYWVDYERVTITPSSAKVKVGKEITLQLNTYIQSQGEDDGSGQDVLPGLPPISLVSVTLPPVWSANGVVNGNANVGTITAGGNGINVRYRAPARVPARNPVAVTAELKNLNYQVGGRTFTNLKVTGNVLVYDEHTYEVKMFAWVDQTSLACGQRAEDEGSFIVQVENNTAKVSDIKNSNVTIPIRTGCPCAQIWMNREISVGPFHITGVQTIHVTPAAPPQKPDAHVRILFRPANAVHPIFFCPNAAAYPIYASPALPKMLEFFAKKEEQVLYDIKESMTGLKIWVRQVSEE
jgi:hypothetical protein